MAIEVFNRYEKKYLMDEQTFKWLTEKIKEHMVVDKHNRDGKFYNIANIYYDTPDDALIRASIEKPIYKEKLRLRSYGVPGLEDEVFLEIKKKYDGIVNKRRTRIKLSEAYEFVEKGVIPTEAEYINKQVISELKYFLDIYNLIPKLYLTYDRMAFFDKDDSDFRVTFDTNIRTRREDVRLEAGNHGELLIGNNLWLMEVKSSKAVPMWFTKLLTEGEIYATSFSKYGTEYKQNIKENNELEGEMTCSRQYLMRQQQLHQYQTKEQLSA